MERTTFHIVDVFTEEKYAGNQLAVFRSASGLSADTMQKLAKEMGFSETTFISSDAEREGGYDVRIFTPAAEVPFAGHPTLGTAHVIRHEIIRTPVPQVILNLPVGQIPVAFERQADGGDIVWMTPKEAVFGEIFDPQEIARLLTINANDIDSDFPIQAVSTGLPFALLPLRSLNAVKRAGVIRDKWLAWVKDRQAKMLFVFCRETAGSANHIHARAYAEHKSTKNRTFQGYQMFRAVLDAILMLRCPKTCLQGGGNPDCVIRLCARKKGLEGCWQCEGSEACDTLKILCTCHGDTVKHNLRMIRQHGVENWSHTRGKHYVWTETHERCSPPNNHPRPNPERHKVGFESIPWQSPTPGVRFKAYEHHGHRLRLAEFTKEFVEPDWCARGHIGYVLEGEMEVDFRSETVTFRAGDGLFLPPGTEHAHKARMRTDFVRVVRVESFGWAVDDHARP